MASNLISKIFSFVFDGWLRSDKGLIISVIVLAVTWCAVVLKYRAKGGQNLPPGPRGLPLFGNLPFLKPDLHTYFTNLAQIYGPIFKLQLGSKLCVVVSSPSLAKEIFKDHDAVFANHKPSIVASVISYGGNDIVFNPYGPNWRMVRKLFVRELMSNRNLDSTHKLRRNEVQQMVRDVYSKSGTPIDIGDLVFVTMLKLIMSMLWGGKLKKEEETSIGIEFRKMITEMNFLLGKTNVSDLFPFLARFDVQGIEQKAKKVISWIDRFMDSVIGERLDQMNGGQEKRVNDDMETKDFLQILLELMQHGDGEISLNVMQLKALLVDIFSGGTDTTTTTIEWALAEMMRHPNIMKKAQEELAQVVGMDSLVEESNLFKFPYLNAVVKETLRMHPVLPLLVPHCPSQSCTIDQYVIPKDTDVFLNVWKMQRDTEAWYTPSLFLPERFSSDTNGFDYKGNNYNYLPFGSGRRICPGIPLAERMSTYLLASLLHSFDWQLPENVSVDFSESFGVILRKAKPLLIIPTRRLSNVELYI